MNHNLAANEILLMGPDPSVSQGMRTLSFPAERSEGKGIQLGAVADLWLPFPSGVLRRRRPGMTGRNTFNLAVLMNPRG